MKIGCLTFSKYAPKEVSSQVPLRPGAPGIQVGVGALVAMACAVVVTITDVVVAMVSVVRLVVVGVGAGKISVSDAPTLTTRRSSCAGRGRAATRGAERKSNA